LTLLVVTIGVALAFGFTNGFHDAAKPSRLIPARAVAATRRLIASIANLAGAFVTAAVTTTINRASSTPVTRRSRFCWQPSRRDRLNL
jgi:phosphate/sulfate permease